MLFILDTNVYVYGLGTSKKPSCQNFIGLLIDSAPAHKLRIPRMIVEEVRRNLVPEIFRKFVAIISEFTVVDEDSVVPFDIGAKYGAMGFKPADAFIAAYTEWTGSEILVSENRHFLSCHGKLPFKVLTAEKCLNLIKC